MMCLISIKSFESQFHDNCSNLVFDVFVYYLGIRQNFKLVFNICPFECWKLNRQIFYLFLSFLKLTRQSSNRGGRIVKSNNQKIDAKKAKISQSTWNLAIGLYFKD